jgi:hypothetical protein
MAAFFRTGRSPITPEEMLEVLAFIDAADESRESDGAAVALTERLARVDL